MTHKQIHPLRRYLFENQIQINDFAKELGVNRNHISEIIRYKRDCGKKLAYRIEEETGGIVTKEQMIFTD